MSDSLMNDRAIAGYFLRAWRTTKCVVTGYEGDLLVSDGYICLRLPKGHVAFDSRRVLPELPADGVVIYSSKSNGVQTKQSATFANTWQSAINLPRRATYTRWLYHIPSWQIGRLFMAGSDRIVIDDSFLRLLGNSDHYLWRAKSPSDPIAADLGEKQVAVFMPLHVDLKHGSGGFLPGYEDA